MKYITGPSLLLHRTEEIQKDQVDHASANNGTKSISTATQKESDLPHFSPTDVMSIPKADTALRIRGKSYSDIKPIA
jgi:hypothetical protein